MVITTDPFMGVNAAIHVVEIAKKGGTNEQDFKND